MDLEDVPFLSPVLGEGAEAHRLLRVGTWTMTLRGADDELLIHDETLAERLGLPLHKLRQLSGRHEEAGNIAPEVSTTVVETGGRPGKRRLYNEADALFLVTRSETPRAVALTREMIRVYMLARRGLLAQQGEAPLVALRAEVSRLAALVDDLRARPALPPPAPLPEFPQDDLSGRLKAALQAAGGSVTQAARLLGLSRRTMHRRLATTGLRDASRRLRGLPPLPEGWGTWNRKRSPGAQPS